MKTSLSKRTGSQEDKVQRKGAGEVPPAYGISFIDSGHVTQRKENKTGLPDNLKSGVESLSGIDMGDVKVHYNSSAPAQLNAYAYAQGSNIHVAPGQEKHLPHEAWHVVQQKQGRVKPTMQLRSKVNVNDDVGLEKEADEMGARAVQRKTDMAGSPLQFRQTGTGVVQGFFIVSNKDKTQVDEAVLDYITQIIRSEQIYEKFARQRDNDKHSFSLMGWINENKDALGTHFSTIKDLMEGNAPADDAAKKSDVKFIDDQHFDSPNQSSGPAFLKYFTDKKSELIPWLTDGNRVRMQQTSGRIRGTAKAEDYVAVRVPLNKVLLLHKIDGPAEAKSAQRAAAIQRVLGGLYPRRAAPGGQKKKKGGKKRGKKKKGPAIQAQAVPTTLFDFAFQRQVFGEANIKVAIDADERIISLDGVGRLRAMELVINKLGLGAKQFYVDVMAIHVSREESNELHDIHRIYYDENRKQRREELPATTGAGIARTLGTPLIKVGNWASDKYKENWKKEKPVERNLAKALTKDQRRFFRNNCLIIAIADALGIAHPPANQIIQIRQRIQQPIGEMLFATAQAIQVIRQVLNTNRPVRIRYTHLAGTAFEHEDFGVGANPLVIEHAHNHFYYTHGQNGSLNRSTISKVGLLDKDVSSKERQQLQMDMKPFEKAFMARFNRDLATVLNGKGFKAMSWLHSVTTSEQFQELCKGGQICLRYSPDLFEGLKHLNAEARKSSHYSGIIIPTTLTQVPDEHYGIDGDFFPTVLFGLMEDPADKKQRYIYIQAERNSYNPSASVKEKVHHVFDASDYTWSQQNQGPYGSSSHTDANPMADKPLAKPGLAQTLHVRRIKAAALMVLRPHLIVPAVLRSIPLPSLRDVPKYVLVGLIILSKLPVAGDGTTDSGPS